MRLGAVIIPWVVALAWTAPFGVAAAEDKRVALLIGNQAYDASVGVLKNPHNDVTLVAQALQGQGFAILPIVKDAKRSAILTAVREFVRRLNDGGPGAIGFLYYSGHGAAEKDTAINYLIPVDAKDPGSTLFWDESLKLDDIMRLLDGARAAAKFVIFDACRNELQLPTRDTSKGLLPVSEQLGFFVAYSSAPGRTASDRGETSGPYAAALAAEFHKRGLDHLNLFQNVKEAVIAATGGTQHPWESNGLTRRVFLTGEPTMPAEIALWEGVRASSDVAEIRRYIEQFPKGLFASTARQMIERLETEANQRDAERKREAERRAREAQSHAELQKALEEARQSREAMLAAERRGAEADIAAKQAKAGVERAIAERNAAAAREEELRTAQKRLLEDATTHSTSERAAATAELERKLAAVTAEARAAREALTAAESRQKQAEQAALDAHQLSQDTKDGTAGTVVASTASTSQLVADIAPDELVRRLQTELKRVGCYFGEVDGTWGASSRGAVEAFVRTTGLTLKSAEPSAEVVNAVASQLVRICPLKCAPSEIEQGGKCVEYTEPKTAGPRPQNKAYSAPLSRTNRPDARAYSRNYWAPRTLIINGPAVTATTPYGVLTCRSFAPASRECSWR
jgi:peptidoglycan hydrolase-like protein with peptidoglycan-binding domain